MKKYECSICNFVYDPETGCPIADVPAGTEFEKIADNFTCPECGAGKDDFKQID